jgi:hypothetical protein
MAKNPPSIATQILSLMALLLAVYFAGYFALAEPGIALGSVRFRNYDYKWLTIFYYPASQVESLVTRMPVHLQYPKSENVPMVDN